MRLKMGLHLLRPALSFVTIPGRISTSCPRRRTPVKIVPPATPPFRSSTSAPGLLTSNDRMTIRRGSEVKSRTGIGMRLTIYSFTASMLYFNCAEIGTMGDASATVPVTSYQSFIIRHSAFQEHPHLLRTPLCSSDAQVPECP